MAQWGQQPQQTGFQYPMQTGFPGPQQPPQFQQQPQQFQQQPQQFQGQPQFQQGNLGLGVGGGPGLLPQQTGFPGQRPGGVLGGPTGFQQQQGPPPVPQIPQQTGFPGGGLGGPGSGFIQAQATGFPGAAGGFGQQRAPPPPVPPIPSQFQQQPQQGLQQQQGLHPLQQNRPSFLNAPPPPQGPNRLLSASPGLVPQATGFAGGLGGGGGIGPLVPQVTGFVDPRLQMLSQTFGALGGGPSASQFSGGPSLLGQGQNLVQSIQEYNQAQRGSANQTMGWALSKSEKKNYDKIFRAWDVQGTGFITGTVALEKFGDSGLPRDDLARIWTLADMHDRGKLNIAEFHVAMGLIYRRLNGMQIPDQLPPELIPPSVADLDSTVDRVKELLKTDTRTGSAASNKHSFNASSPSPLGIDARRDASNYKHSDSEPPGGFYRPSNRHVDRSAIRSRNEEDSPAADLNDMKRALENTAHMLDRAHEADAKRTKEDEELEQEMEDLKYRVKRVQDDLNYVSRGPKTAAREEERRRLEREMLQLMHEKIPEVERKIKARDERKERERREWARERDRANERFGRYDRTSGYDDRDRDRDRPYSRGDYDRPYSRGLDDRDRPYSRGALDDRDRPYSRGAGGYDRDRDRDRDRDYDDRYRSGRNRDRDRDYDRDRPRSPPRSPAPPASAPAPPAAAPAAPAPPISPAPSSSTPNLKAMTPAERAAYLREQAQRKVQERMAALGIASPAPSSPGGAGAGGAGQSASGLDVSVEDRLAQEKKEAEEKAKEAERLAEERERNRRERVERERGIKEGAQAAAVMPTPTSTAPPPQPTPRAAPPAPAAPAAKAAPPPPKPRGTAPPPPAPRRAAAPPAPPAPRGAPAAPTRAPVAPTPPRAPSFQAPPPPAPAPVPVQEEEDPEEKALREREERLRKQKEERERRMRQLEEEERAAEEEFERERQRRLEAARARSAQPVVVESPPAPVPPVVSTPQKSAAPSFAAPASSTTSPAEKSTNPFSRLIKEGGASAATSPSAGAANASPNPWASAAAAPSPPAAPPAPPAPQPPSRQQTSSIPPSSTRSPAPPTSKSPAPRSSYQTAPSSLDDDDWDDIKEKSDDDDDSSDDEITKSRAARKDIAESLFRGIMPSATPPVGRPGSAASGGGLKSPTSPAFGAGGAPPAPPPPAAPPAPPAPGAPAPPPPPAPAAPRIQAPAPTSASGPGDVSALMKSIQSGMKLKPTKTVDKSGPPVSGKVLGDAAPPEHINAAPRAPSPAQQHEAYPEPTPMGGNHDDSFASKSSNRQSVGWFADRAADLGASPTSPSLSPSASASAFASHMPPMVEEKDEEDDSDADDMYVKDVDVSVSHHSHSSGASEGYEVVSKPSSSLGDSGMGVPQITVDEHKDGESGLMADIDKSVEHRVRSLYAFEGDGPEDLSFPENVVIVANPSKTGGDWWYGTMVQTGKSGLFPKTYVEVITPRTAKAAFAYEASNPDELAFSEGETLSIIDTSEEEWWKAERGGVVYIVPAAYLELVEGMTHGNDQQVQSAKVENRLPSADASVPTGPPEFASLAHAARADGHEDDHDDSDKPTMRHAVDQGAGLHGQRDPSSASTVVDYADDDTETDSDSDIDSDYLSFEESDDEEGEEASAVATAADKAARERERQLVLEAAGLIVNKDVGRPPARARSVRRGHSQHQQLKPRGVNAGGDEQGQQQEQQQQQQHHRRPAPAAPGPRRVPSMYKDLPPVPSSEPVSHEAALDDAFARYEYFKNNQAANNLNRLSVISTDSAVSGMPSSPTTSTAPSREGKERERERDAEGGRYSHFLHFLRSGGNRTPEDGDRSAQKRSVSTLTISSPMPIGGASSATSSTSAVDGGATSPSRSSSPSFGMSWASLVDKNALEGIPPGERKRQEAIFELINTEVAYVRDLQLIVEVFYSSMIPMLSQKEITVVFANVEDLLLTNTAFVSSLEERQKDCRLYIDKIGDILLTHIPSMAVYTEYCVNQSVAIKVLKSLRDSNPELAGHLQRLRDENPRVRNLDLSSYLLAPMQRITRYPLLIKQILHYTEVGDEYEAIKTSQDMAEKILDHINETIREQEGYETLKKLSQDLWIGKGRLDLTAPTKFMGPRRLVREGPLSKAKSGKRLHAFLCSDILVLVDDSMKNLYRLPIPLAHAQVSGSRGKLAMRKFSALNETAFQITQAYPRGGESVSLRAPSAKDCQQWVQDIGSAGRRARHAEERAARRAGRR
ncbi:hypothetical protein CVT26_002719 [Gymnopilus dilepis]|uniref:Actin cytoskeleton-regulatory complex protein PAN1 n=1 Tax=Gymnopilus dilepis TaxID=231916 RepID=A0A409Y3C0_9AGAR|nr:hypothetical protein CVT26_002719 [Gymnopilus dilepis]